MSIQQYNCIVKVKDIFAPDGARGLKYHKISNPKEFLLYIEREGHTIIAAFFYYHSPDSARHRKYAGYFRPKMGLHLNK